MAPSPPPKRSFPLDSPPDSLDEEDYRSSPKKRRIDSHSPQTERAESTPAEKEDGNVATTIAEMVQVAHSKNEEMDLSLQRSIAIALKHVGFDSASKEALESFLLLTNAFISNVLSNVTLSTTTCRRTLPIPQDYQHAFKQMKIDPSSLVPHTKLPQGLPPLQPQFQPQDPPPPPYIDYTALLAPDLTGATDKGSRKYIPKNLPRFPALHTYKYTSYYAFEREQDPSKIREKGAEDRRNVELILHRQLDERKHQGRRSIARSSNQCEKVKKTDKLWELAMSEGNAGSGENVAEAKVVVVNAARKYGRKLRPMIKKSSTDGGNGNPAVSALLKT